MFKGAIFKWVQIHRATLRPWSSWTANSGQKYMELNGAALNVNKPCVTSRKTALQVENEKLQLPFYKFISYPKICMSNSTEIATIK